MHALLRYVSRKFKSYYADNDEEDESYGVFVECCQSSSNGVWPAPRSGHRMCADDNYLYVYGGYDANQNNALYPELWRYNITTENWTKLPDEEDRIPKECLSSCMLLWRRRIIVFGGTAYPFANEKGDKIHIYCLRSYKWTCVDNPPTAPSDDQCDDESISSQTFCQCVKRRLPGSSPGGKYGHSMSLCERTGDIYIFSGTQRFVALDELHRFNLMSMSWEHLQFCPHHDRNLPCARYRHEAVSNGDGFWILGGSNLSSDMIDDISYKTLHFFDFNESRWTEHPCLSSSKTTVSDQEVYDYPASRLAYSCVISGDSVCMIGGRQNGTGSLLNDVWIFSLKEKLWTKSEHDFPFDIGFHASAVTAHGCMYIFGGTDSSDVRSDKLNKMWLCAPSLKEQTWLKIVRLLKKQGRLTKETLVGLGVPSNFFCRLDDSVR